MTTYDTTPFDAGAQHDDEELERAALRERAHPRILDSDALAAAADAAGRAPVPIETGLVLIDSDPDVIATFLAPRPWHERTDLLNRGIVQDYETLIECYLEQEALDPPARRKAHDLFIQGVREALAAILLRLEQKAPRPRTASAMLLYVLSSDERHQRAARAFFETEEAELRAFEPGTGLAILRAMMRIRAEQCAEGIGHD